MDKNCSNCKYNYSRWIRLFTTIETARLKKSTSCDFFFYANVLTISSLTK